MFIFIQMSPLPRMVSPAPSLMLIPESVCQFSLQFGGQYNMLIEQYQFVHPPVVKWLAEKSSFMMPE